jgi:hypothetical protein
MMNKDKPFLHFYAMFVLGATIIFLMQSVSLLFTSFTFKQLLVVHLMLALLGTAMIGSMQLVFALAKEYVGYVFLGFAFIKMIVVFFVLWVLIHRLAWPKELLLIQFGAVLFPYLALEAWIAVKAVAVTH